MFKLLSFVCAIVTWLVCPRSCPDICEAPWRWQLRCRTEKFAVGSKEALMCHWEQTYQLVAHWRWQASARTTVVMVAGHAFEETDWASGKPLGVGLGGNHHRHRSRSFLILCQSCHRRGYDLRHREESYQGNCERVCLLRPLCSLNLWHEIGMHENPSPGKRGSKIKWQENTNARHCKGCEFIPSRLNPDWRILGRS